MFRPASLRPPAYLSAVCFLVAFLSFLLGWLLAWMAADDVIEFYYQARPLAVTHTFALGWISLTIMGVLYQFVPALTKQPLPWPRLAGVQVALYVAGAGGLVSQFWIGNPVGVQCSGFLLLAGVILFAAEMAVPLLRTSLADATLLGVATAVFFLLVAALLGVLYAVDKVYPYLPGNVLSNIAAHAHVALFGWITVTICAVSYRMVAAFVLPDVPFPARARRQIIVLCVVVSLLTVSQLLGSRLSAVLSVLLAATLLWYALMLAEFLRTRHMPLDWSMGHVLAALLHLALAGVCGLALALFLDAESETGSRVAVAYGVFLFIGWTSNYIVGMGVRMLSGLMRRGGQVLLPEFWRAVVFVLLNVGTVAMVGAILAGDALRLRLAMLLPAASGVVLALAIVHRWVRGQPAPSAAAGA